MSYRKYKIGALVRTVNGKPNNKGLGVIIYGPAGYPEKWKVRWMVMPKFKNNNRLAMHHEVWCSRQQIKVMSAG